MSKNRIKAPDRITTIPATREEAETLLGSLAKLKHQEASLKAEMDTRLLAVRKVYEDRLAALNDAVENMRQDLEAWAVSNRSEFAGRQSLQMIHGTIGWRVNPPSLTPLRGFTWASCIQRLLDLERMEHIRTKQEVNKESLLAVRDTEDLSRFGLKVEQKEPFYVEPTMTEVADRVVGPAA